jgi:4a-hydroxytetrahydrobiopterin dehydratase
MVVHGAGYGPMLTRQAASDAVYGSGWRFLLGVLRTAVPVGSLAESAAVLAEVARAAGPDGDQRVRADVRDGRVVLTVGPPGLTSVTARETELAQRLSAGLRQAGFTVDPDVGSDGGAARSVQLMEIAIDALDIARIRPFWQAVLGYGDETEESGDTDALVDPLWQGPAVWFQQMDAPRPQRNRIHFDLCLPHDEVARRLAAAQAAGGHVVSDAAAPAFVVLADAEGNEICLTTWRGRD